MFMKDPLSLGQFTLEFSYQENFRLFSCQNIFSQKSYLALQQAFDEVDWVKKEMPFYSQYESFVMPSDKHALSSLFDPSFYFPFKEKLEKLLGVSLQNKIRLAAHKLITSDEIGMHNDYCNPELGHENFRFIFQFARPSQLSSGGELTFIGSRYNRDDIIKKYSYSSNMGICFEINRESHHLVTPVNGERHTLVMYLWSRDRKCNEAAIEIKSY